jgi:23S rRNA (uracil1939-C5)-methyltransferase
MEKSLRLLKTSEVIVVDPPRKGLETFVLDAIDQSQAEQLIYLSCSTSSFIRDCGRLLKSGWSIEKAFGYLFFPGSNHVETLCILKRN